MNLDYKIIYSNRKTIGISVERDKSVVVRAPKDTSPEKIDRVVESKKLWLYEKINTSKKYEPKTDPKEFVSGESLMYLGKKYRLDIDSSDDKRVRFSNRFIISKKVRPAASRLFKTWYYHRAKEKIIPKVKLFAERLGVQYNEIKISNMKYRWGSCTPKDTLNFNWRLIKAPMFVIEYVIVHELAHLLEGNHTPKFWNIVSVQIPNYLKAREWLKENGGVLEVDI